MVTLRTAVGHHQEERHGAESGQVPRGWSIQPPVIVENNAERSFFIMTQPFIVVAAHIFLQKMFHHKCCGKKRKDRALSRLFFAHF